MPNDCDNPCLPHCDSAFERVVVSYLLTGGTTVFYTLSPEFTDPRPYLFQLQVGQSDVQAADDWEDVGAPVTDILWSVDGEQRIHGMNRWQFYRVKLTTNLGVYYSRPTGLMGTLSHRDWRLAAMQLRSEVVYMRHGDGQVGYLLKKRVAGPPCPHCLDYQTREVTQPYCAYCHGTGRLCGYFFPIGCVWADIEPKTQHLTTEMNRGTTGGIICNARVANSWVLGEGDVFVQKVTDDRYYVHEVQNVTEYRGVPIAAMVKLRLAPASDPLYTIEIPGQVETMTLGI